MTDDNIQREIKDILDRLDKFVPEENKVVRMRRRSSGATGRFVRSLFAPLAGISVQQVMLTALVLIFAGFVLGRVMPFGRWVLIAGVVLFVTSFALSFFSRGSSAGGYERRWRGQRMDLREPTLWDKLRARFQQRPRRY